ncbi:MAG TPA: NADPH-dependent F420 reductase [Acidimicrobiales bacterium]|nr:NADPH-dependent F420 reductase [Acidimicrobiales bacterium]
MQIGVIGGTGPAGQAVAVQFAGIGIEAVVGSRALDRAEEAVAALRQRYPDRDLPLVPGENAGAAAADVVVVATPWDGILATISPLEEALAGKVVITMANALTRFGKEMVPLLPPTGSVTVAVARALPRSRVVGAFHHLPAGPWSDLDHPLDADVMVFADDKEARAEVAALVSRLPGLRGVESGGLGSGLAIEALTPALLEVNRRYKTHAAIRLTGIPD